MPSPVTIVTGGHAVAVTTREGEVLVAVTPAGGTAVTVTLDPAGAFHVAAQIASAAMAIDADTDPVLVPRLRLA